MPIFSKISDLFKNKVYVDSGPLEENNQNIQKKKQSEGEEILGGQNYKDNKQKTQKPFLNENSEKDINNISKYTSTYPNSFSIDIRNISKAEEFQGNSKSEFNVNK